jgi:uncharacterized protein YcbK (DUF882 family)
MEIDWTTYKYPVSKYFTVGDCLFLPRWHLLANENYGLNDEIKGNLIALCNKLDIVRDFFKTPMITHCTFRPVAYNKEIGGALNSAHTLGKAMDFHVKDMDCDEARNKMIPMLEEWGLRLEDLPGAGWCHLDMNPVINNRFFKP